MILVNITMLSLLGNDIHQDDTQGPSAPLSIKGDNAKKSPQDMHLGKSIYFVAQSRLVNGSFLAHNELASVFLVAHHHPPRPILQRLG